MTKIIIDTNVLVSALIQKNYPFQILKTVLSVSEIEICLSRELLNEYIEVLNRPKFSKYADFTSNARVLIQLIEKIAVFYISTSTLNILDDEADNRLLELAEISEADFLITGNSNDFKITSYKKTKIMSPKDYWTYLLSH
jgi:uncharacterized protein